MSDSLIDKQADAIHRVADQHGTRNIRIFGSGPAGTSTETSDLDLLVDLDVDRDLLDLAAFKLDLEDLLGCGVDVVTEAGLSPHLRAGIMNEARPV